MFRFCYCTQEQKSKLRERDDQRTPLQQLLGQKVNLIFRVYIRVFKLNACIVRKKNTSTY